MRVAGSYFELMICVRFMVRIIAEGFLKRPKNPVRIRAGLCGGLSARRGLAAERIVLHADGEPCIAPVDVPQCERLALSLRKERGGAFAEAPERVQTSEA